MQEFEYRLEKEDYKNWIHWNVLKHVQENEDGVGTLICRIFSSLSGKKCDAGKGQSGSSCTVHRDSGAGRHRHVLHDFKPEPGADDLETERT